MAIVDPASAVETMTPSLLIAGGEADNNLRAVINGAASVGWVSRSETQHIQVTAKCSVSWLIPA